METQKKQLHRLLLLSLWFILSPVAFANQHTMIDWEDLEPEGYSMESIVEKYRDQLDAIPEDDPKSEALIAKIQDELNSSPTKKEMDGKKIKIPGLISPVDENTENIAEFLLVPYFSDNAPPKNQTVYVTPKENIARNNLYAPIFVSGTIKTVEVETEKGIAGYKIANAIITPYTD